MALERKLLRRRTINLKSLEANANFSKHVLNVCRVSQDEHRTKIRNGIMLHSNSKEKLHKSPLLTPRNLLNPPSVFLEDIRRGPVGVTPVKTGS